MNGELKLVDLLKYSSHVEDKVKTLATLMSAWEKAEDDRRKRGWTGRSAIRWIQHNYTMEFAGSSAIGDVQWPLQPVPGSEGEKDMEQCQKLLNATYNPKPTLIDHVFGTNKLLRWHSILFGHLNEAWGCFRVGEAKCLSCADTAHVYPHHAIVPTSVLNLERIVFDLTYTLIRKCRYQRRKYDFRLL